MSTPELFRLASVLAVYPPPESLARLELAEDADAPLAEELAVVRAAFETRPARERESDYVELFARGVADCPLHGTGCARDRADGVAERLADVGAFFRTSASSPPAVCSRARCQRSREVS